MKTGQRLNWAKENPCALSNACSYGYRMIARAHPVILGKIFSYTIRSLYILIFDKLITFLN